MRRVETVKVKHRPCFAWGGGGVADALEIPRKICTFQVFRLGTDLQKHGTMKDAEAILRYEQIKTTAEVYMDHIPDSVSVAIEAKEWLLR
jgi:hypothetical protein